MERELASSTTLRVEFAAVSLSSDSKLRFRHMLEGLERDWVYDSRSREATDTNPPAGDYRLRVSPTHDGQWAEAGVWAFTVAPPWFLHPWFLAAGGVALGTVGALGWWLRVRALVGVQPDVRVIADASNGEQAIAQYLAHRGIIHI